MTIGPAQIRSVLEYVLPYPENAGGSIPLAKLAVPCGAQLLAVRVKNGRPVLCVAVNAEAKAEKRIFATCATYRHMVPAERSLEYVDTYAFNEGTELFHVFEVLP